MGEEQKNAELRRYLGIALNRWWILLLVPTIMGMVAYFSADSPTGVPMYMAESRILVQQTNPYTGLPTSDQYNNRQLANVYQEIVEEENVLSEVALQLGLEQDPLTLRGWIDTNVIESTPILSITARRPDPVLAANVANKTAEVFVTSIQRSRLTNIARLQALALAEGVADEGQIVRQQLVAMGSLSIIRTATVPSDPIPVVSSSTFRVAAAAFLGVMLAILLALGLELFRDKISYPEQLETKTGIRKFGVIPRWPSASNQRGIIMQDQPWTHYAESYRQLAAKIHSNYQPKADRPTTLVITSSVPREGKTTTTVNLALALAMGGAKTTIVDGDPWKPSLHKILNVENDYGFGDLIRGSDVPLKVLKHPVEGVKNLSVVPMGTERQKIGDNWERNSIDQALDIIKSEGDFVLIDTGPVLLSSSALDLTSYADSVILVVGSNKTTNSDLQKTVEFIEGVRPDDMDQPLNALLNRFQPGRSEIYSYYQYKRYYSHYMKYKDYYTSANKESDETSTRTHNRLSRLIRRVYLYK